MSNADFVKSVSVPAQVEMRDHKILASLIIAQAVLESGWGQSELSRSANNLFGVKGDGDNGHVTMTTTEYENGVSYQTKANFRKYTSVGASIKDHTFVLLFPRYVNLIGELNFVTACNNVQEDGYATDPHYADKLITIINKNGLYRFDLRIDVDGFLKKGERSDRVQVLQMLMNRYGYKLEVDGDFGPITQGAVRDFQRVNSLTIDGIVGWQTANEL